MQDFMVREKIVEVGKKLAEHFFVASNDGNISVRVSSNEVIITPTGVNKGDLKTSDILKIDMQGKLLSGSGKPSSETKMHLAVYRERPDIKAIVHAHPPTATGFAASRIRLDQNIILPEVIFGLGKIGFAEYGTPTTEELPIQVSKVIKDSDALLLSNHGALTVADEVMKAYYQMEVLEMYTRVMLVCIQLGGAKPLNNTQVQDLYRIREQKGWGSRPVDLIKNSRPSQEEVITNIVLRVLKEEQYR